MLFSALWTIPQPKNGILNIKLFRKAVSREQLTFFNRKQINPGFLWDPDTFWRARSAIGKRQ